MCEFDCGCDPGGSVKGQGANLTLVHRAKKHNSEAVAAAVAIFTHGLLHQNRERFPATTQNWESE